MATKRKTLRVAELIAELATLVEANRVSDVTPIVLRMDPPGWHATVYMDLGHVTVEDLPAFQQPTVVLNGD